MAEQPPEAFRILAVELRREMESQGLRIRTLATRMGDPNGARNCVRQALRGEPVKLSSLLRIAEALDCRLFIRLVPRSGANRATLPADAGPPA